jgi:macrolide-specific efflux system membrane fusion protein
MVISGSSSSSTTTASSQRIAVIRSQGNPIATFNVSEIDVSKIKYGQKATITLDSLSDITFTGKIVSVDRIGSVSSGVTNYPVIIAFDTGNDQVLPNMSATANIITTTKDNALLVPTTAIQTQSGQAVVRVLDKNNQVTTVDVTTGLSSDTQTEIVSGVSEGQTIITSTVFSGTTSTSGSSIFSSLGGGARTGGAVRVNTTGR